MSNVGELLIVSVTPQNLERGALWFKENLDSIKKAQLPPLETHTRPVCIRERKAKPPNGSSGGASEDRTKFLTGQANPWWRDNSFFIEPDLVMKPSELIRRLVDFGYERAQTVRGRGLFAVRGGIIEVWPINTEKPYLVEFAGNVILSIHERPEKIPSEVKPHFYRSPTSIEKLQPGSYVVHIDHGIGIFRGVSAENKFPISNYQFSNKSQFSISKNQNEYFVIEYAAPTPGKEPDRLYVPTDQKNRLSPYVGFETPRIHRLGGTVWQSTKRKVREDAEKLAKELLALYAKRIVVEREPYTGDRMLEEELRTTFPFLETEDQIRAEQEIMHDLEGRKPMDRVLCGDVGFGKTELAIRAALRVIASGRQAALLATTTVLAAQHEKTFRDRFSNQLSIINVAALSRLTPSKEEKKILEGLKNGSVDCVIGTHRLLSHDVQFRNLGLVIIDEEQRFGVKQKERFKELRAEVDILSLSATPIPRTLSLALARLRDLSLIETPPPERLPIKTFVLPYSKKIIAQAIAFEIARGGQVYFLHNRIETLDQVRKELVALLTQTKFRSKSPKLSLGQIHGRMKEKGLIRVMDRFRNKEIGVLIATTIIENGLDISNANTLIVDDATRLGLAEAHQLRGRIGRGATQAYAYFLYKPRHLTEKAADRLGALKEYSELGSGYQIALKDLGIRGAGNVLGREQSGAINRVGLNLYCQILAEAAESTRKDNEKPKSASRA